MAHVRREVRVVVDQRVATGFLERALQRAAPAQPLAAVDVPDARVLAGEPVGDLRGTVGTAVLGDDDLEAPLGEEVGERRERDTNRLLDGGLLVVRGEDDAHLDVTHRRWVVGRE